MPNECSMQHVERKKNAAADALERGYHLSSMSFCADSARNAHTSIPLPRTTPHLHLVNHSHPPL
jgi:hypothetical protein